MPVCVGVAKKCERFCYYTKKSNFVLYLQAKLANQKLRWVKIYALFFVCVFFPLFDDVLPDRMRGIPQNGHHRDGNHVCPLLLMAFPSLGGRNEKKAVYSDLAIIALGTGLFKGNLQALVGRLYDNPTYESKRDSGFSLFYMFINVGAMFAPTTAQAVVNTVLKSHHWIYDSRIPELVHKLRTGGLSQEAQQEFLRIAQLQEPSVTLNRLSDFGHQYVQVLGTAYQLGFGVACLSLIASFILFIWGRPTYEPLTRSASSTKQTTASQPETLSPHETKERLTALILVFIAVIFFGWLFTKTVLP